eukprot:Blabericola_migrator_1__9155@NODE_48_length_16467_cov_53_390427_g44_i0_p8_GENE_NODE_48_length_16467_cov_53_390427_g44_i0NODE_48_length_16467_cov_53_390427_g44_i0_p8_ORF_typecomplete_len259_score19_16Apolipoprotein/PF01442_18/0_65Senescence/PF06911_12/0_2Senescence/PF06911_12/3_9e02Tape_meas_lam_C/PF09718_10/51Tape_meas_lam_C/PF09718_10/33_NODE_48_length_16467_cov_53_390427_g44_i072097985
MKFIEFFFIATLAAAGPLGNKSSHHHGLTKRKENKQGTVVAQQQSPPLRRARSANPRKLGDLEPIDPLRLLYSQPFGGLLGMPRDILSNMLGGPGAALNQLTGATSNQPAHIVQNHIGGFVDRTRNMADSSLDTVEQIAQGVAQRSRSVLDRATSRAAGFVDHSVALGSNSLGAGMDAARSLQEEAKRIAQTAAGAASGAVKAGELAFAGAFDKLAGAVNGAVTTHDSLLTHETTGANQQGLLMNPLGTLMNLAAGTI